MKVILKWGFSPFLIQQRKTNNLTDHDEHISPKQQQKHNAS